MANPRTRRRRRKSKCVGLRRRTCKSKKKCRMTKHRRRRKHCRTTANRRRMKRLRSLSGGGRRQRRQRRQRRRRTQRGGSHILTGALKAINDLLLPFAFFTGAKMVSGKKRKTRRRPRRFRRR